MTKVEEYRNIIDFLNKEELLEFLAYKKSNKNYDRKEIEAISSYINECAYEIEKAKIIKGKFPDEYATKKLISKEGSEKKRVVYSYTDNVNITLKFIAYKLHYFDKFFCDNCYSFRRKYGVKNAIDKIKGVPDIEKKYCLKVDIKNYFNSMDIDILLDKLDLFKTQDKYLYNVFTNILTEKKVVFNENIIEDKHGGMAGIPISAFFANLYMTDIDNEFSIQGQYYRYSDDILIFASTYEELLQLKQKLYNMLDKLKLEINPEKEKISKPYEEWEFLGFSYVNKQIDLSSNTINKMKRKIKRKANALRRWQKRKGLTEDKAAKGFINTFNRKLYGNDNEFSIEMCTKEFTWSRWFFPNITSISGLKIIDKYMQEYIRYIITGRHYKGNYKIKYSKLKEWGYRSLVNEYYKWKKNIDET